MRRSDSRKRIGGGNSSIGASWAFGVAVILSVGVLGLALAQLARHGSWPPFTTSRADLSLGETGDFFGGWANSLALVWLVAVAWLQFQALKTQQADLKLSRKEMRYTREEIRRQAESAADQARYTAAILKLQRQKTVLDFQSYTQVALERATRSAAEAADASTNREEFRNKSFWQLAELLTKSLQSHRDELSASRENRSGTLRRIANHLKDIIELFDDAEEAANVAEDQKLREYFNRRRTASHLYDRCIDFQQWVSEIRPSVKDIER